MKEKCIKTLKTIVQHWKLVMCVVCALCVVVLIWVGWRTLHSSDSPLIGITHSERIETTPEEIRVLKDLGQWEFLSVEIEELVEHHEAKTFGNSHLVKIYRGRLSLGVDMATASDDWFRDSASIAIVTLPAIQLLDDHFIDEGRTVTFYEKGQHNAAVKQRLYDKAAAAMKQRAMAPQNIAEAEEAARQHFARLILPFGYKDIVVRFENQ